MKVLFIGEGRHDIGDPNPVASEPRQAQGTIPSLSLRICPNIDKKSVALSWTEVRRFNSKGSKSGFQAKIVAAALIAARRFGCAGTVVVADQDGKVDRKTALQDGADRATALFAGHRVVWGLAIESVEAWTLGAPEKIAEVLEIDVDLVQKQYPRGAAIESLLEGSGKPDKRPKRLLECVAQLKNRSDCTEFREEVAKRTDVVALERECQKGFAPFAKRLREAFGQ